MLLKSSGDSLFPEEPNLHGGLHICKRGRGAETLLAPVNCRFIYICKCGGCIHYYYYCSHMNGSYSYMVEEDSDN
jgi:hypothetical protein